MSLKRRLLGPLQRLTAVIPAEALPASVANDYDRDARGC